MISIDQELWNLLFGWMQEGQCMILEGCTVPLEGLAFYLALVAVVAAAIYFRKKIRENFLDLTEALQGVLGKI